MDIDHIKKQVPIDLQKHINPWFLFDSITSTNEFLLKEPLPDTKKIAVCLTEAQTAGRGQHGRRWHSPAHTNIYLSLAIFTAHDFSTLSSLSLDAATALRDTLSSFGNFPLQIKPPNDILADNKKLAGILTELNSQKNQLTKIVLGVGLNINMLADEPNNIDQPWTSLLTLLGHPLDRNIVAGKLIGALAALLKTLL